MENIKSELYKAIFEVQKKVSVLEKDETNPFFKSQYLSLAGLLKALRPELEINGLIVIQSPLEAGKLQTEVIHAATGQSMASTMELPLKDNTPQGAGSAISYARRYSLMAIFNIAAEDDDGNAASTPARKDAAYPKQDYYKQALERIAAITEPETLKDAIDKISNSELYTKKQIGELITLCNSRLDSLLK